MPSSDVLSLFGLSHNPFTDRTAEKTDLNDISLYMHSDLAGFRPSDTTYIFFGKRGSGKTTIRLKMMDAYHTYNEEAAAAGRSRGHFMVDLSRPGHLTSCLRAFQDRLAASGRNAESWDADFSDSWTTADLVDCMLSYAATNLMTKLRSRKAAAGPSDEASEMLQALKASPKVLRQFLILAHLYANTDTASLQWLRAALVPSPLTVTQALVGASVGLTLVAGVSAAMSSPSVSSALLGPAIKACNEACRVAPALRSHPRVLATSAATAAALGTSWFASSCRKRSLGRASDIQANIRVVKQWPVEVISSLLDSITSSQDSAANIRQMYIGVSAHQKLELLRELVVQLGYESIATFCDCIDEVTLLDPVLYPGAVKIFAREVCRNDLLNFGRLHFFFPDSRLALDLNTDRTLKEARFDRHFVRDLTWTRHQLEELAERRFRSAQRAKALALERTGLTPPKHEANGNGNADCISFLELFNHVKAEDFSSYLSKISTPRELMIMMTEMLSRIESQPDGTLTAQDLEMACNKALEQAV